MYLLISNLEKQITDIYHSVVQFLTLFVVSKTDSYCMVDSGSDPVKPKTVAFVFTASRLKSNDWLALNQINVSEWSDMYTCKTIVSVS